MEKKNDGPPKGRYVQEERRRTKPLDMQESLRLQKEFAAAQRAASQAAPQNAPKSTLRANPKTATAKKSVPTKAEQLKKPNLKKDLQLESSLPTSSEQEEQPLNPQMDFKNVDFSLERLQKEATWRLWEEKSEFFPSKFSYCFFPLFCFSAHKGNQNSVSEFFLFQCLLF